jgi:hypothetical protein
LRKLILAVFILMLCAVFISPAQANIISREKLAGRLDNNYQAINSYLLVVSFGKGDLSLRIWQRSGLWRQEWVQVSGSTEDVVAAAVGQGWFPLMSVGFDDPGPPIAMVLFEGLSWWEDAGLEFDSQSHHFFHGRPALAVGMDTREDPGPYLWMDNEDMVPLRMVFPENDTGLELGWIEHGNIGNYKLPRKLIISGNDFEMICTLEWRGINSVYEDQLFSPEDFEKSFSAAGLNPPELVGDYYRALSGIYK